MISEVDFLKETEYKLSVASSNLSSKIHHTIIFVKNRIKELEEMQNEN